MKSRNPYNRDDLEIKKCERVVEIGPGHHPNFRSNILVEKFIDSNYHRNDNVHVYPHQQLVRGDGECLPFQDKEFDYIICCQVLEHADDPAKFITEHCRVAKRGYLEAPSLFGEFMFPKESHKWAVLEIDNKIVMFEKSLMGSNFKPDFGNLFLDYLPSKSLVYRVMLLLYADLYLVRYEWKDDIEFLINPEDPYYRAFFTEKWTPEMIQKIFPARSITKEFGLAVKALIYIASCTIKRKFRNAQLKSVEKDTVL